MSARLKASCDDLLTFLRGNLGRGALGALTGTDRKALAAAVHILELYNYGGDDSTLEAFRLVVLKMQRSTRELAYHAIAYTMEWHSRAEIWARAGLPPLERVSVCEAEPTVPERNFRNWHHPVDETTAGRDLDRDREAEL